MIGIPAQPDRLALLLLALGILAACIYAIRFRRSGLAPVERLAGVALLIVIATGPFLVWRVGSDLRVTTAMNAQELEGAGPVQSYLPPYLLDPVRRLIPAGATYATVVSPRIPYEAARKGFPALALATLFPRVSADPVHADWIVAWGGDLQGRSDVARIVVARPAFGYSPPVLVARVRHR